MCFESKKLYCIAFKIQYAELKFNILNIASEI